MIFQHSLIENIVSGKKTQTRRPVKPGDYLDYRFKPNPEDILDNPRIVRSANKHMRWMVGNDYAIVPKRAAPGLWFHPETGDIGFKRLANYGYVPLRIRILDIRREDCRSISEADAQAEGFDSAVAFLKLWCSIYDKQAFERPAATAARLLGTYQTWLADTRPAALYDAWVLRFEVVK